MDAFSTNLTGLMTYDPITSYYAVSCSILLDVSSMILLLLFADPWTAFLVADTSDGSSARIATIRHVRYQRTERNTLRIRLYTYWAHLRRADISDKIWCQSMH